MIVRPPLALLLPAKAARRRSAPPRHRTARSALLWGAVAFVLAQLGFAVAVETVLPQIRDPEYGYHQIRAIDLQKAHPDRPLVLVLGTSRAQNALDPSAMGFPNEPGAPLVFNAGMSGSRPVNIPLNLRRFRDAGIRPAAVLVEVFPATLFVPGPADYLFAETEHRLTAADLRQLEPSIADPAGLKARWAAARVNSLHTLRTSIVGTVAPKWQRMKVTDYPWASLDRYGFIPYAFEEMKDEHRERRRAHVEKTYADCVRHLRVSELTDRSYRALAADCRAANIPVAFFFTPESPVYRGWYTPESRATLAAFKRMLTDELGAPVFDAPAGYAEEDFADGHHMLRSSAQRFSRELAERHVGPWLASVR